MKSHPAETGALISVVLTICAVVFFNPRFFHVSFASHNLSVMTALTPIIAVGTLACVIAMRNSLKLLFLDLLIIAFLFFFLARNILGPENAFIPRLLWDSKPVQNIGLWYTNQVMGLDFYSSTAMSQFTYLNFAGGPLAVILGFLMVGIFQRGLFDGLRHFGGGGLIVLFGMLGTLVIIDSAFDTFFISIIRFLPILVVAQYVLLQRPRRLCAE